MVKLRDYQLEDDQKINEGFDSGLRSILYVLPTGCGKTTVFCSLVQQYLTRGKYINIIVHRIELIDQIHSRLKSFGIESGIIAGKAKVDHKQRVQVSSVQTLTKRNAPPADLVIIDEAHHALAETYTRLWKEYPFAKILGVTATPIRLSGDGFENHFQTMINSRPLAWYFSHNYLVKPIHHVCSMIDSSSLPIVNGEYDQQVLGQLVTGKHKADLLNAYQKYASGKKAVVFCQNVNHSKITAELFNMAGIPACHLDGDTPTIERKRIIRHFRTGRIMVLTNVDIVSEGFDIPDIEAVVLGALTKSLARYKQQVGRSFRLSEGKVHGLVLDCVGMWLEHQSMAMDDYEWTLTGKPKLVRQIDTEITDDVEQPDVENILQDSGLSGEDLADVPMHGLTSEGNVIPLSSMEDVEENIRLIPISERLRRLVIFEAYLVKARKNKHKPLWAVYEYQRYLRRQHRGLTDEELQYCRDRLSEEGIQVQDGFWYYLQNIQMEFEFPPEIAG